MFNVLYYLVYIRNDMGEIFNMKTLNVIFTNKEFSRIRRVKELTGLNWHNWIIMLAEISERENKSREVK